VVSHFDLTKSLATAFWKGLMQDKGGRVIQKHKELQQSRRMDAKRWMTGIEVCCTLEEDELWKK